ncbi:helix-turn-helix transcriptional regulator [Lentilactobacillus raoultii]|uniref:Helix-turn-helix transcriptional regulator n=1 Tax=Lentilactobacillus raoultii TaxID=1987503 RepID=A0ABW3PG21_9LACO|nr:helix-turn-helix transcriptional regulator [Lentilactobacillus raoultii]
MGDLANKLKRYRAKKGLTQAALAEKLSISRKTVSSWENGHSFPKFSTIIQLSKVFGIKVDDLLKGDEKVIEHFNKQDKQVRKDKRILKVCYYLNTFLLILSYVNMFKPFGFHSSLISLTLIGNMIIFFSQYSNWKLFKKKEQLTRLVIGFFLFLFLNSTTMIFNVSFQRTLVPGDAIAIIGASSGEFTLILFITISWTLAVFFRSAKKNK